VSFKDRGLFVHLAYLDDSGTRDKNRKFQVLSAVIIEGLGFSHIEVIMGASIEALVPPDKQEKFEEFHAHELYGGYGIFEGVEQTKRFHVITLLLNLIPRLDIPVVYGAVNKSLLADKPYGSADPLDICFRLCIQGIEEWTATFPHSDSVPDAPAIPPPPLVVLVSDDFQQKDIKATLKKSFRQMRKKIRPPHWDPGTIWHLHDDLYFGSSADSVGIQLADLCGYMISRHLEGDTEVDGFYNIIKDRIVWSKVAPE
jgi:hypothetical protein